MVGILSYRCTVVLRCNRSRNLNALDLTLIGMRGDTFTSLSFWDFVIGVYFYQKFPKFLEVKIEINQVNLTSSLSLMKMPPGGAKDEHFSCFPSSCQWGLSNTRYSTSVVWEKLKTKVSMHLHFFARFHWYSMKCIKWNCKKETFEFVKNSTSISLQYAVGTFILLLTQ